MGSVRVCDMVTTGGADSGVCGAVCQGSYTGKQNLGPDWVLKHYRETEKLIFS